jgi:hypothetical protein
MYQTSRTVVNSSTRSTVLYSSFHVRLFSNGKKEAAFVQKKTHEFENDFSPCARTAKDEKNKGCIRYGGLECDMYMLFGKIRCGNV